MVAERLRHQVGKPGTHFIPPGISGFEEAGGEKGPGFDFLANPKGDMAVAEKYMKEAGYSSGKYDGTNELLMRNQFRAWATFMTQGMED